MNINHPSDTYMANYYEQHKEHMKASAKIYKSENSEKIKETNKKYRKNYNKLNVICSKCKRLLLKSSLNRHNKRRHSQE
tara:strand:+ start:208 stop:444 length:237 start_codon:yes stop_codon:yes gene_type:complete